jgi:DNA-directed RNA polymerase subunit RPC12/RpoP
MESYPRNRCPECREYFRLEIKAPATPPNAVFDPSVMVCPRCGFKFMRFPIVPQEGATKPTRA